MSSDQKLFTNTLASLAKDMHALGIREIFGIAGDPITPLIDSAESLGIKYLGFRNEQAASYAAPAVSFLTRRARIGVCMTVAGPGLTNALTGLANAKMNQWPCILVCPFTPNPNEFQYVDQVRCIQGSTKGHVYYSGFDSLKAAIDTANSPPFGPVVVFVPKHTDAVVEERSIASQIISRLAKLSFPKSQGRTRLLLVVGGTAPLYPEHDSAIHEFLNTVGCPFISDPMGRGVVSEQHRYCVTAARSDAMRTASVAVVIGGKLDWMLSHGKPPKWSEDCKFILVGEDVGLDGIYPEIQARVIASPMHALGDVLTSCAELSIDREWGDGLMRNAVLKREKLAKTLSEVRARQLPSHYEAIGAIKRAIFEARLEDSVIVSEGANTMDVARVALDSISNPCRRMDAGRWGTMGSGLGMTIAAATVKPDDIVICIHGDSAFGFSGMELETLVRYKCRAVVVVFNNGGIYTGIRSNSTAFTPNIHHDMLMKSVGGVGLSTGGGDAHAVYMSVLRAFDLVKHGQYPLLVDINIDPKSGTVSGSLSRL